MIPQGAIFTNDRRGTGGLTSVPMMNLMSQTYSERFVNTRDDGWEKDFTNLHSHVLSVFVVQGFILESALEM